MLPAIATVDRRITAALIWLSVGLESTEDLIDDFVAALGSRYFFGAGAGSLGVAGAAALAAAGAGGLVSAAGVTRPAVAARAACRLTFVAANASPRT